MTPLETANLVPMFIGNTLRSYSPNGQRNVTLSRRESDTYVLFFYMLILRMRQSPSVRIVPDKDTFPEDPKNVARHPADGTSAWKPMARVCLLSGSLRDVSRFGEPSAAAPENKGDIGR